jgi:hypothetical protein
MTMIRYGTILLATAVLVTTGVAQQVLGNNKGKVRAVNALADISAAEQPLQWSRRDFQDATNTEIFGFWPAYTIQRPLFDPLVFGTGDDTGAVTITTVDSLVTLAGQQASPFRALSFGRAAPTRTTVQTATTTRLAPSGLSTSWTTAIQVAGMCARSKYSLGMCAM